MVAPTSTKRMPVSVAPAQWQPHGGLHPGWQRYAVPPTLPAPLIADPQLPLVSVVVPSYNQGQFLASTLASILTQDYPNLEVWVIDGGSTDATLDVLAQFAHDPRLHWVSEPDGGQADAVNKGWRRSQGTILGWLNSDDTYLPGAVRTQVAALLAHPAAGVVYGNAVYTDTQGNHMGSYAARPYDRTRLLHLPFIPQPTVFVRRAVAMQAAPLALDLHQSLDYEYLLRLSEVTDFAYTPQPLATYRLHDSSKSVASNGQQVKQAVFLALRASQRRGVPWQPVVSDWCWLGAGLAVERGEWARLLAYTVAAVRCAPLRPRAGFVALRLLDRLLHTHFSDRLLERRVTNGHPTT